MPFYHRASESRHGASFPQSDAAIFLMPKEGISSHAGAVKIRRLGPTGSLTPSASHCQQYHSRVALHA